MKKRMFAIAAILAVLAALWFGGRTAGPEASGEERRALRRASEDLGVNVRDGEVLSFEDTHGGMGDGNTWLAVSFPDGQGGKRVQGRWKPLPLTENLSVLIYGSKSRGPWMTDEEGKNPVPVIAEGYYYFRDRHSEAEDPDSDFAIFRRSSFNFTLGLYDAGTNTLYYLRADT